MPSVELAAILTGFRLVSSGATVVELTKETIKKNYPPEYGRLHDKVRDLMGKRSVLDEASSFEMKEDDKGEPVQSPIVDALCNLYAADVGVIYVMYAPPGQGKTFGAQAFLKYFCQFDEEESVQGFMVSGQTLDDNYMLHLRDFLGATEEVDGWIHAVLLALDEPKGHQPSILILDGFNSLGKDDVNEAFIKELYGLIGGKKNLFVVIMTSDDTLASKICTFNDGQRIQPLPNTYTGKKTAPEWNRMEWSRDQLIEAIRYTFPDDFPENHKFEFIADPMTPLQAIMAAQKMTRAVKIPGSLTRKKRS